MPKPKHKTLKKHPKKNPTKPPYPGYVGLAHELPRSDKRRALYRKQREERGFDDTEFWNLDMSFAQFLYPRLEAFRKSRFLGIPSGLTASEWKGILVKMERGLEKIAKKSYGLNAEEQKQADEAMQLLAHYWSHLWD